MFRIISIAIVVVALLFMWIVGVYLAEIRLLLTEIRDSLKKGK